MVRRFDSSSWFGTTTGIRTSTSTRANGITAMGEFAIGDQEIDHYAVSASSPQTVGLVFSTTVTAEDVLTEPVVDDNTTVVTMTGTGNVQFDGNGDATFGDNTKTLAAGTFSINTKDNTAETINITATDGNGKTGTRTGVVVNVASASQVAFVQQPTDVVAGVTISPDRKFWPLRVAF